jgi:ABC-type multidrug transport system fused ATPase/permease subunit
LNSLRQTVAHVGADPLLVNGTVRQNLEYSGHVLDKSIEEKVTSFIGLQNSTELDMPIGKSGMNLSDGQKHKVAFIRAVLSQPKILILDEVFSSLDEEDLTYLFEWCKKADVVFLVSRKKEVLAHADRLLTICHGEVVEKV